MKEKIEISQADMLQLIVDKVEFLTSEYKNLHSAFEFQGKSKIKTDALRVASSYEKFLKEEGDIDRLLELYKLFGGEIKSKKTTASK
jgi:hypothetical protein